MELKKLRAKKQTTQRLRERQLHWEQEREKWNFFASKNNYDYNSNNYNSSENNSNVYNSNNKNRSYF